MKKEPYDVMIVLGAQVRPEGLPSKALARRLALALGRYRERPVPVICCGAQGPGEPVAEGDFMCAWLGERGVPAALLHSERQSYDTLENIRFAKEIMDIHGYTRALVVTSDYHVRRALAICKYYGLPAQGAGSPSVPRYWLKNNARELLAWGKFLLVRLGDRRARRR